MLELKPLYTATYGLADALQFAGGPRGNMTIGAITSVDLKGDRIKATLASPAAADWMVHTGTIGVIDVRLALRTDDDALIYMTYGGRIDLTKVATGNAEAIVAPVFETGDERYAWLNAIQAVGRGRLITGEGGMKLEYEVYEVC